ncbi:hypothetical protein JCM9279_004586 [Rhodotorula babjevae]
MAAAVMRAMTFGSPSSRSSSTATSGGDSSSRGRTSDRDADSRSSESRSASRGGSALARTISRDLSGSEGGESLSRTSSRLTAAGSPPPPSILLNSTSPHIYANQSATSSTASNLDLLSSTASTPRPALHRLPSDASSSYSQVGPTTPASSTFPLPPHQAVGSPPALVSTASDNTKGPRQSTIRFAPLPEIRPRSYSTGRNVWIVDEDDGEGAGGQQRTRLVRVGSDVEHDDDGYDDDDALDFASGDDDVDEGRSGGTKWGSWSDTLSSGMWGLTPSTSRRSNLSADDDAVSLSSSAEGGAHGGSVASGGSGGGSKKLLKAFGLGSVVGVAKGKKKRSGAGGDDDVLARTSSGESQLSRRSSVDASAAAAAAAARPKGSTGIPLRKASTWEVGDAPDSASNRSAANNGGGGGGEGGGGTGSTGGPVYYASPARTNRRRANYPPVAQRSRSSRGRGPPAVRVEEPKFSEWGGSGVGSRSTGSGGGGAGDDDDGSGMAWIRKRRLEREKEAREKAEREAREKEEGQVEDDEERDQVGEPLEQQRAPSPPPPMVTAQSLPLPSQLEAFRRGRQPPSRSGTLDSTISTASTIRPSTPTQSPSTPPTPVVGGLSATRPALVIEVPSRPSSSTASPDSDGETPVTSPVGEDDEEDSDEEEEDEEEDEEEEESDDDDDLDEEELAREEELAEEARRSAKSMGAERYHSHQHECEVKVVAPTASPEPSS